MLQQIRLKQTDFQYVCIKTALFTNKDSVFLFRSCWWFTCISALIGSIWSIQSDGAFQQAAMWSVLCYFFKGTAEKQQRWEFVQQSAGLPVVWAAWLHKNQLSSFFLSPHQPPLHQLSVKSCYETHTNLYQRVCVCVCADCPFGRQQYTEAPLRKIALLLNRWESLLSGCETLCHTHPGSNKYIQAHRNKLYYCWKFTHTFLIINLH